MNLPTAKCGKCGHKWTPRIAEPVKCPKCKSYGWNKPQAKAKRMANPKREIL